LDGAILDGLGELDFLAVLSPYFPETLADKAHVLMPKPLWMEEDGTYSALDGCEIAYKKKVLNAPSDIKDSWHTFSLLAERIGFHSEFKSWKDLAEEAQRRIQYNEPGKKSTGTK
jgi:predicted molibdopterin-dependent oxidoreductase YjgC